MYSDGFDLEIFTPEKADVYVACPAERPISWPIVRRLDEARIRAVTNPRDWEPDEEHVRQIMKDCSALVVVLPDQSVEARVLVSPTIRLGAEMGLPIAILAGPDARVTLRESPDGLNLQLGDSSPIPISPGQVHGPIFYSEQHGFPAETEETGSLFGRFLAAVLKDPRRMRPYAFFVGRLERDFTHAREAITAAVEAEAGIPCLWSDDGRHRMNVDGVREGTRLLIEHAAFIIADLTLGTESPKRENPSRAHEIGMTIGYGRKLMLCSQEPRRDPYFSIGDMQMTFWSTEDDLECKVREWIRAGRAFPSRRVLNHELTDAYPGLVPRIRKPNFTFDAGRRYIGPNTKTAPRVKAPIVALGGGAICLALAHLATLRFGLGSGAYWAAYIVLVFTVFVWPHLNGRTRGVLGSARLVEQFFVLLALTLMTLALATTKTP